MTNTFTKMYLVGGVSTMRTAGSIEANINLNIKNLINQGKMFGQIFTCLHPKRIQERSRILLKQNI